MTIAEIEFSGRTIMLLGGLSTLFFVLLIAWMAIRYNKKKKSNI